MTAMTKRLPSLSSNRCSWVSDLGQSSRLSDTSTVAPTPIAAKTFFVRYPTAKVAAAAARRHDADDGHLDEWTVDARMDAVAFRLLWLAHLRACSGADACVRCGVLCAAMCISPVVVCVYCRWVTGGTVAETRSWELVACIGLCILYIPLFALCVPGFCFTSLVGFAC